MTDSTVINVLGGAKWSNLCSPCLYNICLKEKWEEDVKWISIQISPASVCFRVSLNSSDVQGEKARFVLQSSLLPRMARSALSIQNTYILKSILSFTALEWQYFCKGQWFLYCLSWRQKYVLRCTQYSLYSKTSIEYCLVYGTFSPFYYISLTWSVIELVR